jgi:hypothetical protein
MGRGVRLGVDLVLRERSKPYISHEFFFEYITTIFLPYLNELRDSEELEACEAVLLMDNCSSHVSDDVVAVLANARVRIITFAPHTTHIFQRLDMVLFEALKKHSNGLKMFRRGATSGRVPAQGLSQLQADHNSSQYMGAFAAI